MDQKLKDVMAAAEKVTSALAIVKSMKHMGKSKRAISLASRYAMHRTRELELVLNRVRREVSVEAS